MKRLKIVGNWKSNKNRDEVGAWISEFDAQVKQRQLLPKLSNYDIVAAVPFPFLDFAKWMIGNLSLPIALAAQDISPFSPGSYTGAVNAKMLSGLATWVIIGHSERRKYFKESDEDLTQKVIQAKEQKLTVIYCVSSDQEFVPPAVDIIAYEPLTAIGSGNAQSPESANQVVSTLKEKYGISLGIYGGSVTSDNVKSFVTQSSIDGVLPGKASLDPVQFCTLIENAVL